jgi:PTS system fructose-specific IIC component
MGPIPHGKNKGVNELSLALGISKEGADFESLDGKAVHILFMVADLADYSPKYLKLLSRISILVRNGEFREAILAASTPKEVLNIIKEYE